MKSFDLGSDSEDDEPVGASSLISLKSMEESLGPQSGSSSHVPSAVPSPRARDISRDLPNISDPRSPTQLTSRQKPPTAAAAAPSCEPSCGSSAPASQSRMATISRPALPPATAAATTASAPVQSSVHVAKSSSLSATAEAISQVSRRVDAPSVNGRTTSGSPRSFPPAAATAASSPPGSMFKASKTVASEARDAVTQTETAVTQAESAVMQPAVQPAQLHPPWSSMPMPIPPPWAWPYAAPPGWSTPMMPHAVPLSLSHPLAMPHASDVPEARVVGVLLG